MLTRGTAISRFRVPAAAVERELERLDTARARSRVQLEQIKARIARRPAPSTRTCSTRSC